MTDLKNNYAKLTKALNDITDHKEAEKIALLAIEQRDHLNDFIEAANERADFLAQSDERY
jgi:hypothetical protein